ncbi:annexin B9-like [Photinus pyralis]|uniref:annexin B9-like n=1 Tax=Photinus pyralis TaxID=7054 RepID=UPI0012674008|nr:annexin B9-like [Photinus pyralis]
MHYQLHATQSLAFLNTREEISAVIAAFLEPDFLNPLREPVENDANKTIVNSTKGLYPLIYNLKKTVLELPGLSPQPAIFNASVDCELIKDALYDGDLSTVVNILTNRLYDQRLEIAHLYKTKYGKILKEELVGHDLIIALVVSTPVFYATELHNAMMGTGTDEDVLIQILCTLNNKQILSVIDAYESERDERKFTDWNKADTDASRLYGAGVEIVGTNEKVFYDILCTRNYNQLRFIFLKYYALPKDQKIEDAIEEEFSGYAKEGLLTIVAVAKNLPGYFAEKIHHCMYANEKRHEQLIRIIIPRSETDMMGSIKEEYSKMYNKSLEFDITEHTKGLFRKAMLNLLH